MSGFDHMPIPWRKEAERLDFLGKIWKFEAAGYALAGISALALCDLIFDWGHVSWPLEDAAGMGQGRNYIVARVIEYFTVGWGLYAGVGMGAVGTYMRLTGGRK